MLGNAGVIDDRQENDLKLNENHRTRQLLKVLAISDIVIYKTRAERLHTDLFYFMGDASKAYNEHFSVELQKVCSYLSNINNSKIRWLYHSDNSIYYTMLRLNRIVVATQCPWGQQSLFFTKLVTQMF